MEPVTSTDFAVSRRAVVAAAAGTWRPAASEGHVPVKEIQRRLKEKPSALGLAVPGMPVGSPGMDGGAYGNRKDPYSVMLLTKDGGATVYQRYEGSKS